MARKQVKPKIKPIDPTAKLYHHFQYSVSEFGLFDDADDGTPIIVGSRNLVDATVRNLPKNVTIFYYKKHSSGFWEKKMKFKGEEPTSLPVQIEKELKSAPF
jgi:hypothetical protein